MEGGSREHRPGVSRGARQTVSWAQREATYIEAPERSRGGDQRKRRAIIIIIPFIVIISIALSCICLLHFQRLFRHLQRPLICLITPDEPRRMAEDAPLDPTDFGQLCISYPTPVLRQGFPVLERIRRGGDTLDAPFTSGLVVLGVKDVKDLRRSWGEGGLEEEEVVFPWCSLSLRQRGSTCTTSIWEEK